MAKKSKKQTVETQPETTGFETAPGEKTLNEETSNEITPDEIVRSENETAGRLTERFWFAGGFLVAAAAILLRFLWLPFKPFHHDEGVNGFFLTNLYRQGVYKYDPQNYHGPTLYYFSLVSSYLFGLNDFAVRAVPALFGVFVVLAALALRRYIGTVGALAAGLLLALSPGMTFISRYFIHEMPFAFFTLGVAVCVVKFIERERAGRIAVGAMTLLLLICLLPGTFNFANLVSAGRSDETQLVAKAIFFVLEACVVYGLMRTLVGWNGGRPIYLLLAAAGVALTFASKETAFISFGTMLIAVACVWIWKKAVDDKNNAAPVLRISIIVLHAALLGAVLYFREELWRQISELFRLLIGQADDGRNYLIFYPIILLATIGSAVWIKLILNIWRGEKAEGGGWIEPIELKFKNFARACGDSFDAVILIALCLLVFAYVSALFFSSFFTYPEGIAGAFEAYNIWTKTGTKDHTQNGVLAYLKWGVKIESPLLVLGAIGSVIAFWKAKHRFAMFAALWAFGLFAAYTIIPYKTPWLAINFWMPMAIIAGYGINELATSRDKWQQAAAAFVAAIAFGVAAYQTIDLNFYRYDDDSMPYVYAHTKRDYNDLLREIDRIAAESGKGKETSIIVVSPDYWGMPWNLRNYKNAGFYGKITASSTAEIVVGKTEQATELEAEYGAYYTHAGNFTLRPGVDLMLYVRNDLAGAR